MCAAAPKRSADLARRTILSTDLPLKVPAVAAFTEYWFMRRLGIRTKVFAT
ncbi:protein of unknown function [Candidatus Methylomirabilis oxygeniifera]|uniref:Uncharacterized protein n=1 Tax=Methylomirabilis oxygeniifera TaxID=671143 RepID=D5MMS6_METO1|nr:protein of unknown function [Candidatus Methylomirabilis oxyfera]